MKMTKTALLLGTLLSAGVMVGVNAGDKKIANTVDENKTQTAGDNQDVFDDPEALNIAYEKGDSKLEDGVHESIALKVTNMFALADTDSDGVLSEAEYIDYQTLQARVQFSAMAGDDRFASLQEVKDWHLAKQTHSDDADQKPDGATGE